MVFIKVRRWKLLAVACGAAAAGAVTARALAVPSPDAVEPEGGVGGYGERRIESELSIHVPAADIENVWQHLADVYDKRQGWPKELDPGAITARLSDERFVDRYFDTPRLDILARQSGVRHRMRDIPDAPDDPKDDRQLVQIKLTSDGDTVKRGEYKFPVRRSVVEKGPQGRRVVDIIKEKHRKTFEEVVRAMGTNPAELQSVVVLKQHRRRVYFKDAKGPMMTVTLDEVDTKKWWATVKWAELELELGEIRYTNASPEERSYMERLREVIKADLFASFPRLYEDNLPKYTEAIAQLEKQLPMWRHAMAARATILPVSVGGLALALAVGVGIQMVRRMRRTRFAD